MARRTGARGSGGALQAEGAAQPTPAYLPGDIVCEHQLTQEDGRHVVRAVCGSCPHGIGVLQDPVCLAGIALATAPVTLLEGVVLAGAVERSYDRAQLVPLQHRQAMAEELEAAAGRQPLQAYGAHITAPLAQKSRCKACAYHPRRLVAPLPALARTDPTAFVTTLEAGLVTLSALPELSGPCPACTSDTAADLLGAVDRLEEQARTSLASAYHVVLD